MATLLIEFHTKPRIKLRLNSDKQPVLSQKLVMYVLRHHSRTEGWTLKNYGKSVCNHCHVVTSPFLDWLRVFGEDNAVSEFLAGCDHFMLKVGKDATPTLTVSIPISWFCVILEPVSSEIRKSWEIRTESVLAYSDAVDYIPYPASDFYLLCESRSLVADEWQQYFKECRDRDIPFIALWHYNPKFKAKFTRYDMLISWLPYTRTYEFIFTSPDFTDVNEVIVSKISSLIKKLKKSGGFKKVKIEDSLVVGQVNILQLNFEEAECLTIEVVKMMKLFIDDMKYKIKSVGE